MLLAAVAAIAIVGVTCTSSSYASPTPSATTSVAPIQSDQGVVVIPTADVVTQDPVAVFNFVGSVAAASEVVLTRPSAVVIAAPVGVSVVGSSSTSTQPAFAKMAEADPQACTGGAYTPPIVITKAYNGGAAAPPLVE